MSREVRTAPNPPVRRTYEELGALLERGDDAFIEEGPGVVQAAIEDPGFFRGVETRRADPGEYTRTKVVGDPGGHVIRFMEWPPEYALLPHEHHGRPCFEVLVDGLLVLADVDAERIGDDEYLLDVTGTEVCHPGDAGVVDPRTGSDVHQVYSPVRTRSLHVYPDDNHHSYGYVLDASDDRAADVYARERFTLRDDA